MNENPFDSMRAIGSDALTVLARYMTQCAAQGLAAMARFGTASIEAQKALEDAKKALDVEGE